MRSFGNTERPKIVCGLARLGATTVDLELAPATPPAKGLASTAAIENEIPTYRAISPLAVGSLICGIAGLLAFVNLWFVCGSLVAIVVGIAAMQKIRRQPDAFTGRGFAQAGIVLGLISSLSSITMTATQSFVIARGAEQFTKNQLLQVFDDHDVDSALWWREKPESRKGVTPDDVHKRYTNPNQGGEGMFDMMAGPVATLMKELEESPGAKVSFERVEQTGVAGVTPFALVLMRITWPPHEHKEGEKHGHGPRGERLAMVIKCHREGRREDWWVEDYVYPYQPNTYQEKMKPVDDGHGH